MRASIAVDDEQACAVEASGHVKCWRDRAVDVGLADAIGVAAGADGTCAWTKQGAVSCWSAGAPPARVAGLDDVVQVSVGESGACALHPNGRVSCWSGSEAPHDVPAPAGVIEIAGSYGGGAVRLCVRTTAGEVACGNSVVAFEAIPELAGATSLAGAGARFAVLTADHRLATWVGWTGRPMPAYVDGVDGDRVILGGHLNEDAGACVLGAHARCWAWACEPSLRLTESPPLPAGVRDLALDDDATCARIGDRVECWGRVGRLGDGTPEYPTDFVAVAGLTGVRQLDAVGRTLCALRGDGHVACWGERLRSGGEDGAEPGAIDIAPVELPGVTDAIEIAMEATDRGDGTDGAIAVCARRARGATCWTATHGTMQAADAPELAAATKLYSGPAVCGIAAHGDVHCAHFAFDRGHIPGFSERDYERFVYSGKPGAVRDELVRRVKHALAGGHLPVGFHDPAGSDPVGPTDARFQPPTAALAGFERLRRIAWATVYRERVHGALCGRRADGTVACWGDRDYLGAGQTSDRAAPVAVTGLAP
ncbi:MAG TPA: hypothetical protein VGF94_12915 [Kofleriaceae bacterium]